MTGAAEALGVASIMPFVAVLSSPENLITNEYLRKAFEFTGSTDALDFLFLFGCLVFLIFVLTMCLRTLSMYIQYRFAVLCELDFATKLNKCFFNNNFEWFLDRNSSDIGRNILSEVETVVNKGVIATLQVFNNILLSVFLVLVLMIVDVKSALFIAGFFGLCFGLIFLGFRGNLRRLGEARLSSNRDRFKAVIEGFSSIKLVKVFGLERFFLKKFRKAAMIYSNGQAKAQLIASLPRQFVELLTFGGVLFVLLLLMHKGNEFDDLIPIVVLYVFAGYRMLPAFQQIYVGVTHLGYVRPALEFVSSQLLIIGSQEAKVEAKYPAKKFEGKVLEFKNVNFQYVKAAGLTLENMSFKIKSPGSYAFIGRTGCGKTTTLDILLGLLNCTDGEFLVDSVPINYQNSGIWSKCVGYVPQDVTLIDDTIIANVAFGLEANQVDFERVKQACTAAQLSSFLENEAEDGYFTQVGERGAKLSGGQIQRLGIARAMYKDPKVLVLDEATSALDVMTESSVSEMVQNLSKNILTIIVAHKLNTIKQCDRIFLLEKGKIVDSGSYQQLMSKNKRFVQHFEMQH